MPVRYFTKRFVYFVEAVVDLLAQTLKRSFNDLNTTSIDVQINDVDRLCLGLVEPNKKTSRLVIVNLFSLFENQINKFIQLSKNDIYSVIAIT